MMWGYYAPGLGWWMVLSSLLWLVLIGAVVWALVRWVGYQTRSAGGHQSSGPSDKTSAEEVLRQRFARGEIDAATFQAMRAQLAAPTDATFTERQPATSGTPAGR